MKTRAELEAAIAVLEKMAEWFKDMQHGMNGSGFHQGIAAAEAKCKQEAEDLRAQLAALGPEPDETAVPRIQDGETGAILARVWNREITPGKAYELLAEEPWTPEDQADFERAIGELPDVIDTPDYRDTKIAELERKLAVECERVADMVGEVANHSINYDAACARIAELEAAMRGIWDLREKTERTYEDAYKSMFKSRGEAEWDAVDAALKGAK